MTVWGKPADDRWPSLGRVLDRVRTLQSSRIFSSHLPAAGGTSLEEFLRVLRNVPDAEPFIPPASEQFVQMIAAMSEIQRGEPNKTGD